MQLQNKPTKNFTTQATTNSIDFNYTRANNMALRNDWDDLMGDIEWEESEIDSGYFDSDNEAGNPMS